jgi:large subunit ribosomal protein L9
MKVLLVEDIDKLGWLGDVVEVSTGYARNYLLPQRLAVIPTEPKKRLSGQRKGYASRSGWRRRQQR